MPNKQKYSGLSIALGAGIGAALGAIAGNIGVWLAVGVAIGVALSAVLRRKETPCADCTEFHRMHEVKAKQLKAKS